MYEPGVDAPKLIAPVDEFIIKPEVELNIPPVTPVILGVGSVSD